MMIDIPVCIRTGPKVHITEDGLYTKKRNGETKWSFEASKVTGKGIFIAGAARSGTVYITNVLKALGYDIGHEKDRVDGSVGYHLAVAVPKNCLHQVRHPLKQIASMKAHQAWGFMQQVIEIHGIGLRGCMEYWLHWNEMIEAFAVWRYRLEDLPNVWDEFLRRIGHEKCEIPNVSKTDNSCYEKNIIEKHRYEELTWDDLFNENKELASRILYKVKEYGYMEKKNDNLDKWKQWCWQDNNGVSDENRKLCIA